MLLIDRKEGTSVIITTESGEQIKITIISNNSFGVKLGFDADKKIKILREEVKDRDQRHRDLT